MNATFIGNSFPEKDKIDFAKRKLVRGSIIYCYAEIAKKNKRILIIGITNDKYYAGVLLFNTDKYFIYNKYLSSLQIHFSADQREYLDHDSYLDCSHIHEIENQKLFDTLVNNPKNFLGSMEKQDFDNVCTTVANAKTMSKKFIVKYGLNGYLFQK
jgi:hypothetical protein